MNELPRAALRTRVPSPDLVKPPLVGAKAPPSGTASVSLLAPRICAMNSRLPATLIMPDPVMALS